MIMSDPTMLVEATTASGRCLSRNETGALVTRAARGAGFSWGLAEEAGFAAGWLARQGIDGAAIMLALLEKTVETSRAAMRPEVTPQGWQAVGQAPLCPIWLGAAILDGEDGVQPLRARQVAHPALLLPFLALLARDCGPLALECGGLRVTIGAAGLAGDVSDLARLAVGDVMITRAGTFPTSAGELPQVACRTISALDALALRTTVPASEASRKGAGAAGDDND